jgi:hypothetical protein
VLTPVDVLHQVMELVVAVGAIIELFILHGMVLLVVA